MQNRCHLDVTVRSITRISGWEDPRRYHTQFDRSHYSLLGKAKTEDHWYRLRRWQRLPLGKESIVDMYTSNCTRAIEKLGQYVTHEGVAHVCYSFGPLPYGTWRIKGVRKWTYITRTSAPALETKLPYNRDFDWNGAFLLRRRRHTSIPRAIMKVQWEKPGPSLFRRSITLKSLVNQSNKWLAIDQIRSDQTLQRVTTSKVVNCEILSWMIWYAWLRGFCHR